MKIAFFGTPENAAITLEKLIRSKFAPSLIVTGADIQKGRGQKLSLSPVKEIAQKNHIRVLEPQNLSNNNFMEAFTNFSPDVAVLIAYGKIIPKDILAIPKHGFVNIHPSLLPKYRGPSPIYQTILNGDQKTGVTIIKLDEELDHGPIIAQAEIDIGPNDTHQSLAKKLASLGADLLIKTLPSYLNGSQKPQKQDHSKATLTRKITKEDGFINLASTPDPITLDRMIRAFYPWPGVYTKLEIKNEKLKIIKFLPNLPTILLTHHPTDPFLIQPEGKRPLTISEFKNGYPGQYKQIENLIKP